MPAEQVGERRASALVGNMCQVDACLLSEQHGPEMDATAAPGGVFVELAGLRLGEVDQLLQVACADRFAHEDNERAGGNQADRREVLAGVVTDIGIECRIDGKSAGTAEPERIAVGRRLCD